MELTDQVRHWSELEKSIGLRWIVIERTGIALLVALTFGILCKLYSAGVVGALEEADNLTGILSENQ